MIGTARRLRGHGTSGTGAMAVAFGTVLLAVVVALVVAALVSGCARHHECVVRDVKVESGRHYRAISTTQCCGSTCITGGVGDAWEVPALPGEAGLQATPTLAISYEDQPSCMTRAPERKTRLAWDDVTSPTYQPAKWHLEECGVGRLLLLQLRYSRVTMKKLALLVALSVTLAIAACVTRAVPVYVPAPAAADASAPYMPATLTPGVDPGVPPVPASSASVARPVASAAPPPPSYHAGDYRQSLPSGTLTLPSLVDGGAPLRIHDGNDSPCMYGCVALYSKLLDGERSATGTVVDAQDILRDATACVKSCPKGGSWPGVER